MKELTGETEHLGERVLRATILGIFYATLASFLCVDYAASAGLFLLAGLGFGLGLVRGFSSGLSSAEKKLLVVFAALPIVAVLSYALGNQTEVGFRMLGRLWRLVLFIPIFVALRWARPRARETGIFLLLGLIGALALAWMQLSGGNGVHAALWNYRHGLFPTAQSGDHISFGDLAVIQGFVAAALIAGGARVAARRRWWFAAAAAAAVLLGGFAAVLSGARGAWLSGLAMAAVGAWLWWRPGRPGVRRYKSTLLLALVVALAASAIIFGPLRSRLAAAWHGVPEAVRTLKGRKPGEQAMRLSACPNSQATLATVRANSQLMGPVKMMVRKGLAWAPSAPAACRSGYYLSVVAAGHGARIRIPRNGASSGNQRASLLARGNFRWRVQGGPWHQEHLKRATVVSAISAKGAGALLPVEIVPEPGRSLELIPMQLHAGAWSDYWARTSSGARLAMWALAARLFVTAPGHGQGFGAFQRSADNAIAQGRAPAAIFGFEHPHSDYLNVLYGSGLLGLLALLALLVGVPRYTALLGRQVPRGSPESFARPALYLLIVGFAAAGLTESLLVHSFCTSWLALICAGLLAGLGARQPVQDTASSVTAGARLRQAFEALYRWWQYRDLLRNLIAKDIKVRYQGAFLGFAWSLMNPLLMSLTYYVVFTVVFKSPIKHYAVYLVTGMLHWNLFALVSADASDVLVGNQDLLKKLAFPRLLIPLSNLCVNLTLWLMGLLVLFVLLKPLGGTFSPVLLVYPLFLLLYLAFLFGIQLILCVLYVDFRDLKHLVEVLLMILFWSAPVVYPLVHLPAVVRPWVELSPLTEFVMIFQSLVYKGALPPAHLVAYFIVWTGLALWTGGTLFVRRGKWVVERL